MRSIRKLTHLIRPYWKQCILSLLLLTAVVMMDLTIPRLIQKIIDQGIAQNNMQVVIQTTIVMLGISLLSAIFAIGNNIFSVQAGEGVARDLREKLFMHIQSFSLGNLDQLNTGQLLVRLSSDASVFQRLVQVLLRIGTRAPLLMIGSLILMFNTDPRLALIVLPLLLLTAVIMTIFVARIGPLFRIVQKKMDRLNSVLQENIAGVRVVKAFVRADFETERFSDANDDHARISIRVMQIMSTMWPLLSMLVNIGIVFVVWFGGLQSIRGELSVGQIVAFINYLQTTMGPLMIMGMISNVLAAGTASAERICEVLDAAPEVQDAPDARTLPAGVQPEIGFENVSFHYNGTNDGDVLKGIELTGRPGETVAILGATGAGKSSLVNLIPRFYDASSGRILFNGIDIRQVKQSNLMSQIGIVPQDTILFSGTMRDNIRYGNPNADDEAVIDAAKAAQAHEFIIQLPEGYDTHIEQRGVNLSGGQKQRIAIARALLPHPAVLILDDSTSSIDVETETKIQEALESWMVGRTCFVVAQRISTVLTADKIIVIDQGIIAAEGTHRELLQTSPIYQEIYASQLGDGPNLN